MERHVFDAVSGAFGIGFLAIAVTQLLSDVIDVNVRWGIVWPIIVVVGGLGLLWTAIRRTQ